MAVDTSVGVQAWFLLLLHWLSWRTQSNILVENHHTLDVTEHWQAQQMHFVQQAVLVCQFLEDEMGPDPTPQCYD